MNIWALEKDLSIRRLLILLQQQLGENTFCLDLDTACHHCAIFLYHASDPKFRAYLYTLGQPPGRYGVHLEFPPEAAEANLYDAYEELTHHAVAEILAVHFDISTIHPLPGDISPGT